MVMIVLLQFFLVLLNTIREVRGQHFLWEVSFALRVPRSGEKSTNGT